jgi:hypothetical protein
VEVRVLSSAFSQSPRKHGGFSRVKRFCPPRRRRGRGPNWGPILRDDDAAQRATLEPAYRRCGPSTYRRIASLVAAQDRCSGMQRAHGPRIPPGCHATQHLEATPGRPRNRADARPAKAQLATAPGRRCGFGDAAFGAGEYRGYRSTPRGDRPVAAHGYPHAIAARDGRARRRLVQLRDLGLAAHGTRPARSATPASARRRSPPAPCPARRPVPTRRGNRRQLTGDAVHARRAPMVRVSTSLRP